MRPLRDRNRNIGGTVTIIRTLLTLCGSPITGFVVSRLLLSVVIRNRRSAQKWALVKSSLVASDQAVPTLQLL